MQNTLIRKIKNIWNSKIVPVLFRFFYLSPPTLVVLYHPLYFQILPLDTIKSTAKSRPRGINLPCIDDVKIFAHHHPCDQRRETNFVHKASLSSLSSSFSPLSHRPLSAFQLSLSPLSFSPQSELSLSNFCHIMPWTSFFLLFFVIQSSRKPEEHRSSWSSEISSLIWWADWATTCMWLWVGCQTQGADLPVLLTVLSESTCLKAIESIEANKETTTFNWIEKRINIVCERRQIYV